MRHILPPEKVKAIYESKIRKLAQIRWEEAGKPEGRDLEFWLSAERDQHEKDMLFGGVLPVSALPDYGSKDQKATDLGITKLTLDDML